MSVIPFMRVSVNVRTDISICLAEEGIQREDMCTL